MNRLRRELRAAHSPETTVTQLVLSWGFTDLGRMSGELGRPGDSHYDAVINRA